MDDKVRMAIEDAVYAALEDGVDPDDIKAEVEYAISTYEA